MDLLPKAELCVELVDNVKNTIAGAKGCCKSYSLGLDTLMVLIAELDFQLTALTVRGSTHTENRSTDSILDQAKNRSR